MNLGDMRLMVRDMLGEDTASYWSDAMLNRLINRSAKEAYAQIIQAYEDHFVTSVNISFVANTELYTPGTIFDKIVLVERIDGTNKMNMMPIPLSRKNDYQSTGIVLPSGNERYFLVGKQIGIAPVPTGAVTNAITVWGVPALADLAADANTFADEWTDLHHEVVVWGAVLRAAARDQKLYALYQPHFERLWSLMVADCQNRQSQEPKRIVPVDDQLY